MTVDFVNQYLERKIEENEECIICSYFDLRGRNNVPDKELGLFRYYATNKLTNMGYKVFYHGQQYMYKGVAYIVKENIELIAIKEKRDRRR